MPFSSKKKNSLEIPKTRLPAIFIRFPFWKILIGKQKRRNIRRKGREVGSASRARVVHYSVFIDLLPNLNFQGTGTSALYRESIHSRKRFYRMLLMCRRIRYYSVTVRVTFSRVPLLTFDVLRHSVDL